MQMDVEKESGKADSGKCEQNQNAPKEIGSFENRTLNVLLGNL